MQSKKNKNIFYLSYTVKKIVDYYKVNLLVLYKTL